MRFLRFRYVVGAALVLLGVWMAAKPGDWQSWLGFSKADYFTYGTIYAFFSGVGPFLLTALGLTTVVSTMLRHLNCHVDGCPWITRHKIANGEFGVCGKHWREVNEHPAGHKITVAHIRARHREHRAARG